VLSLGPDIGGGAIRAYGMYMDSIIYINNDTFTGNSCSNGGAISGLYANFDVFDSVLTGNKATGWARTPSSRARRAAAAAVRSTLTATTTTWSSTAAR